MELSRRLQGMFFFVDVFELLRCHLQFLRSPLIVLVSIGRLHDVNMNMASHAERVVPANPNDKSTYTASSRQILELMSRYTRLFNLLTYASFTRSHRPILTPRGLRRLVERGLMTAQEREVLVDAVIPATQRHSVVLMWMIRLFIEGRAAGHIQGGHGFESETMHKFHIIRSQYGAIGDELQGRMPLAYAHIVQVLVDLILWMFPIMAFATGMSPLLVVFGTGLLTMSYQGLFDLAKQFLDPYDNENYGRGEDPLSVDTLIAETNAGSVRWLYGFEELPFSAQRLSDGELYEYLLPVRGYSVEELDEMERERVEREKQLEEQRKREDEEAAAAEAERLRKEAEEEKEREEQELEDDLQAIEMVKELNGVETDEVEANATMAESLEALEALEDLEKVTQLLVNDDDSPTEIADVNGNATKSEVNQETVEEESNDTQIESELETDDASETTKSVHKVTTLATDGSPITSFKPSEQMKPVVEEPVPSGMQTSNYLATLRMQTERIKSLLAAAELEEEDLAEQALLDFEAYQDLPWFDEVGSDGQEFRLSQQLADEDWVEEITDDIRVKNMTKEEYEERLKEIEQNAEDELKETIEIMSATPGDEGQEDIYTVAERKKKKAPTYDQTRLDGISQLWGLPPEDPSALTEYEPPEKVDDVDFSSISQLWGGGALSDTPSGTTTVQKQDDSDLVGMGSFAGISELWGPTGNYLQEDIGSLDSDAFPKNKTISESGEEEDEGPGEYVSFMGLPWHDEKGPDGQDYRLSQMLADEEWASDSESEEEKPMTLEDYNEQVKEITEKLEEELRETEAILMSKPGTDPVGWDYDDEQLAPMSNVTNAEEEEEPVKDSDLAVLEMDVDVDEELKAPEDVSGDAEAATVNGDAEEADSEPAIPTGDAEIDEGLEPNGGDSVVMASTDKLDIDAMIGGDSSSDEEIMEVSDIDETVTEAPSDQLEEESSDVMDETPSTDGKNKIEPIFLEEQDEGQDVVESPPTADDDGEEEDDVRL